MGVKDRRGLPWGFWVDQCSFGACREEREGSRPARNLLWEQSTAFALLVSLLLPVPLCHSLGVGAAARALLLPEHGRARDARIPSSLDATAGQGAPRG